MHRVPALGFLLLVSFPSVLRAQSTNASLTGRVTDPSKATIAEAKVAAIHLGTNYRYGSTTNGASEYTLANLPPGTYRLEVEKPGFKKLIRPTCSCMYRTRWQSISGLSILARYHINKAAQRA